MGPPTFEDPKAAVLRNRANGEDGHQAPKRPEGLRKVYRLLPRLQYLVHARNGSRVADDRNSWPNSSSHRRFPQAYSSLSPTFIFAMSLFSCPRLSLLLLALATLPPSIIAEPLPSSIVIFHPADGSIANSSADEASQYGLIGGSPGDYLQKVEFSLTYPNGTVSGGGGVSSGGCLSRGGTYTFGFNNSQAGEYVSWSSAYCSSTLIQFSLSRPQMLEALVSVAVEVDGVCPGPEDHQNSTVSVKWRYALPMLLHSLC